MANSLSGDFKHKKSIISDPSLAPSATPTRPGSRVKQMAALTYEGPAITTATMVQQCAFGKDSVFTGNTQPPKTLLQTITYSSSDASFTCNEAQGEIEDTVSRMRGGVDFSSFHVVEGYLKFLEQERQVNPAITELEALHKFRSDSQDELFKMRGSTCVGNAQAVVQALSNRRVLGHPISAYVITNSEGPGHPETHAAVLVPCRDGVILVEFSWDCLLLVLRPNEEYIVDNGVIRLNFQLLNIPGDTYTPDRPIIRHCETIKEGRSSSMEYLLRPSPNPDLAVINHFLLAETAYPFCGYTASRITKSVIKYDVERGEMTFQDGQGRNAVRVSIPFEELNIDWENGSIDHPRFREFISHPDHAGFFAYFRTNKDVIFRQIQMLAKNHESMRNLHLQNVMTQIKSQLQERDKSKLTPSFQLLAKLLQHSRVDDRMKAFAASQFTTPEVDLIFKKVHEMREESKKAHEKEAKNASMEQWTDAIVSKLYELFNRPQI